MRKKKLGDILADALVKSIRKSVNGKNKEKANTIEKGASPPVVIPPPQVKPSEPKNDLQPQTTTPEIKVIPPPVLDIVIPKWKDGTQLQYTYSNVKIKLLNEEALRKYHQQKKWYFTPKEIDGEIHLFIEDDDIGTLKNRENMVKDWLEKGDPYIICFNNLSEKYGATVYIAFYRDKRKYNQWREQTVVPLLSYRSEAKQDIIMCLREGEEVKFDDNGEYTRINVLVDEGIIGNLPAKTAKRYTAEGAYAAFIEKTERDDGKGVFDYKEQPYIRIFWNKRAENKDKSSPQIDGTTE